MLNSAVVEHSSSRIGLTFNWRRADSECSILYIWCRYYTELGCDDSMVGDSRQPHYTGICSVYIMCPVDDDLWYNLFTSGLYSHHQPCFSHQLYFY